jgi:hypothetical protein
MPVGLSFALIALAQAASAASPISTAVPPASAVKATAVPAPDRPDGCEAQPRGDSRTIVVCAPKPQGYRIDPDVLEARREARNRGHTQPKPPETMQVNNCATVGPMGCRGNAGIDLVSAAAVLGEMIARASQGGNVGQMFVTEPTESEYQFYVDAKKRREADEAKAAAANAKAKARTPHPPAASPLPPTAPTTTNSIPSSAGH